MRHVNAFRDDALGELDAVGMVDALRTGRVSRADLIEAAIARTEAVNPALNGLAHPTFERARAEAAGSGSGGYFDGVPTFVKDNVAVAGMPTMQGTDAWDPVPHPEHGDFAEFYLATGLIPLGKTQLSEFGFSASAEHPRIGAVRNPWDTDYTANDLIVRFRRLRRGRGRADRARQRRWWIHPNPGRLQRISRTQTVSWPAASGQVIASDAGPARQRRRAHAVGARHRRVLP